MRFNHTEIVRKYITKMVLVILLLLTVAGEYEVVMGYDIVPFSTNYSGIVPVSMQTQYSHHDTFLDFYGNVINESQEAIMHDGPYPWIGLVHHYYQNSGKFVCFYLSRDAYIYDVGDTASAIVRERTELGALSITGETRYCFDYAEMKLEDGTGEHNSGSSSLTLKVPETCSRNTKSVTLATDNGYYTGVGDGYQNRLHNLSMNGVAPTINGNDISWKVPFVGAPGDEITIVPSSNNGYIRMALLSVVAEYEGGIPEILTFTSDKPLFNPDAGETVGLNGTLSTSAHWQVTVAGRVFTGTGSSVSINWDGRDNNGAIVAPGIHDATLSISDCGVGYGSGITISIRTPPCDVTVTDFSKQKQNLNAGNGQVEVLTGAISSSRPFNWDIAIKDTGRSFTGSASDPGASVSAQWEGKDIFGNIVAEGTYTATLTARSIDNKCSDKKDIDIEVICGSSKGNLYACFASSVNVATGNLSHSQDLFSLKGGSLPASVSLSYNSLAPRSGPIDADLIHHFQKVLQVQADDSILYRQWNGSRLYTLADGLYQPPAGDASTLVKNADGSYVVTEADGEVNSFNPAGKVVATVEADGTTYSFAYSADSVTVTDPTARSTTFSILYYNSINPMTSSLSHGWSHSYEIALQDQGNGAILFKEGSTSRLYRRSGDSYTSPPDDLSTMVKNGDGSFVVTEKDGFRHNFDQWGRLVSRQDRSGSVMSFAYEGGRLSSVTDGAGRSSVFAYDAAGKLASIADPKGNAYGFAYTAGNLTTVTHPDGGQWRYTYDDAGYLLTKTDPGDHLTTYGYDIQHRAISGTDPEGQSRELAYAAPQEGSETVKTTTFKEKDGGEWRHVYDTDTGTLTSKTDPQGNTTSFTYDERGNILSRTEPGVGATRYSYDASDNMTSVIDPLGNVTTYTYNSRGQVLTTAGPAGTTTNSYDASGNLLSVIDPAGTTAYEYDSRGNVTKITDPLGRETTSTYDASGLLTSTTAAGIVTSYTYDLNGNLATSTTADKTTTYGYDGMNRLTSVTDPLGHVTTYGYDKLGNRTSVTDANGNVTVSTYNYRGQLLTSTDPLGKTTTYAYGADGCPACGGGVDKLTALTDASGNTTRWEYDLLGHMVKEIDPLQKETGFTYDRAGRLSRKSDANGAATAFRYDPLKRLVQKSYPGGATVRYSYDVAGRKQSIASSGFPTASANIAYTYSYDSTGRMTGVSDSRGYTIAYEYDPTGSRTRMTLQPGTAEEKITTYGYDSAGRLQTITSPAGTFTYDYDTLGRRSSLAYPNQITATYGYDDANRLTGLTHAAASGTIAGFTYTHDNAGNRKSKTTQELEQYIYDTTYRLLTVTSSKPETFSYDPVGNRLTGPGAKDSDYQHNAANQMTAGRKLAFAYDNNGNQATRTVQNASDKQWQLSWDSENRLTGMERKEGASSNRTVTFSYDPMGRRTGKQAVMTINGTTTTETYEYVYDNDNIVLEIYTDPSGATEKTWYTHGAGVDEHLAMERNSAVYFYHADGLGSVTTITDSSRAIVQAYEYDSFGMVTPSTSFRNSYTYTGREWDRKTGTYHYRKRTYDPMDGRFISKDPIGFRGGINKYAYSKNNPIRYKDPFGLYVEVGERPFYPADWVPYARHCFLRFNGSNTDTLSYDNKGVHADPNPAGASFSKTSGNDCADDCVRKEMNKCQGSDYDFLDFNCCMCASNALYKCGLKKQGPWPNRPSDASNPPFTPPDHTNPPTPEMGP